MGETVSGLEAEKNNLSTHGVAHTRVTLPYNVKSLASTFVESQGCFFDNTQKVYERWGWVLTWAPEARQRGLCHDYTNLFKEGMTTDNSQRTYAAMEMAALQMHFYWYLLERNLVFRSVSYPNWQQAQLWYDRLRKRFGEQMARKRNLPLEDMVDKFALEIKYH